MRNILVALDGSNNSLRGLSKDIEIAKENQSTITGLNIIQVPLSYFVSRPKIKIPEKTVKASKTILANAKNRCTKVGISFKSQLISGGDPG